ncbi:hypothetical protein PG987_011320 [Apiospora arundinis]
MTPSHFPLQCESALMHPSHQMQHGNAIQQTLGTPAPVTPAKRPDADMDDVQFISSKPVKRQKVNHPTNGPAPDTMPVLPVQLQPQPESQPMSQYQSVLQMDYGSSLTTPMATAPSTDGGAMSWPNTEVNHSHDRRTTTGMVGLPSGFSDWESIFGHRGCSLPELENYDINATGLKPAITSSPAISPKQIPKTVTLTALQPGVAPSESDHTPPDKQMTRPGTSPPPAAMTGTIASDEAVGHSAGNPTEAQQKETMCKKVAGGMAPIQHPSPTPCNSRPEQSQQMTPTPLEEQLTSTSNKSNQSHTSKQPCKACLQVFQHRAAFARAQGLPFVNPNMPLHMLPPGPYHTAFGPQAHPQFMSTMPAGVHPIGPGSNHMMMPMTMHSYSGGIMPPSILPQQQQHVVQPLPPKSTTTTAQQQLATTQTFVPGGKSSTGVRGRQNVQTTAPAATGPGSPAKRSPRPPPPHPSLLQPSYRKPSPNLIVDVAETCQEKFPFEEVAKRHDTTVEKVADVFAAIIQVPLLRCPKDRRRAGRLAHERVKEYNKTKRDLQDSATATETNSSPAYRANVVRPLDIANALGPSE